MIRMDEDVYQKKSFSKQMAKIKNFYKKSVFASSTFSEFQCEWERWTHAALCWTVSGKRCLFGRASTLSDYEKNPSGKLDVSFLNQRHWYDDHTMSNLVEKHQRKSHPEALWPKFLSFHKSTPPCQRPINILSIETRRWGEMCFPAT